RGGWRGGGRWGGRRGPTRLWGGAPPYQPPPPPVAALSGGQRQTVAIAKAVLWNSNLVLLDEPTAALGVAQTRQVLDLVRRLAEQGLGVVLISHNLADVFEVADRIAVLYLGRMAAQVRTAEVTTGQVVELITAGRSGDLGLARPEAVAL
ncbi:ATP-binding cassette domain-containing protein, partial [Nocardia tengchongensis]|uniref:ATP-binding cassette domain-containing protein n=1 Tax=Nocardia tengchongensis TaxID=2055889 RepID=UPI0036AEA780